MEPDISPELPEDQLPQEVVAALKQRYAVPKDVPQAVDLAVLADAERHLSSVLPKSASPARERRFAWVAASVGSLVAAALLVLLTPWSAQDDALNNQVASRQSSDDSVAADFDSAMRDSSIAAASVSELGDVDGNGQIDIRDAFAVARAIQSGQPSMPEWDRNGDGIVDGADVDLIALTAVTL
jgi:hypothetical protein